MMTSLQQKKLIEGLTLFNEQKFYEAHEAIEEIWLHWKGNEKFFLQGLIQLAASFHHFSKRKNKESMIAFYRAKLKLMKFSNFYFGIKIKKIIRESEFFFTQHTKIKEKLSDPSLIKFPRIKFKMIKSK